MARKRVKIFKSAKRNTTRAYKRTADRKTYAKKSHNKRWIKANWLKG